MDATERRLLEQKRRVLLARLARTGEFVRGSVVLMKRRCVRPRCARCLSGERHPTWALTCSVRGKTRTVYLGAGRLGEARRLAANYAKVSDLIEQVAWINLALLIDRAPPPDRKEDRP